MFGKGNERLNFDIQPNRVELKGRSTVNGTVEEDTGENRFIMKAARKALKSQHQYRPCIIMGPAEYERRKRQES